MSDERRHGFEQAEVHQPENRTGVRLNLTAEQLLHLWPVAVGAYVCGMLMLAAAREHPRFIALWTVAGVLEAARVLIGHRQIRSPAEEPARRMRLLWLVLACETAVLLFIQSAVFGGSSHELQAGMTLIGLVLLVQLSCTTGWDLRAFMVCGTPIALVISVGWLSRGGLHDVANAVAVATGYGLSVLLLKEQDRQFWIEQQALREERALRSELDRARREADTAEISKTRFFAAASHDLRQPLHALAVNATTLQLVAARLGDPLVKELSDSINSSLSHSDHLLDSLLDISRLDARALPPQLALVDTADMVRALHAEFSPLARQEGLEFHCSAGQGSKVQSDREMLTRILRNLISNALKFTPRGGHVEVESRDVGNEVILLVRDTGPGIPFEMRERIFEEFCQLKNPARDRSKGLGLGLSIVKRLAALLEIRVQVDSVPGQGTCFSVRLPRIWILDTDEGAHSEMTPQGDHAGLLRGHRILVVDDAPEVLKSLHSLLREIGVAVASATDLASSMRVIEGGFQPTLLVLDFRLGNENGLEVLAYIRSRLGDLPALMLSGDTVDVRLRDCVDAITVVEHKPLNGQRLVSALARVANPLAWRSAQ